MWFLIHVESNRVVGISATEGSSAYAPDVASRFSHLGPCHAFEIGDSDAAGAYARAYLSDNLRAEYSNGRYSLFVTGQKRTNLIIASDAPDVHPVDGIPEIPSDGTSTTLITVTKTDLEGKPLTTPEHTDQLYLRTDHGTLLDAAGEQEITRVTMIAGVARFRLRSDTKKRVATVQVFNADRNLTDASIRIEFI